MPIDKSLMEQHIKTYKNNKRDRTVYVKVETQFFFLKYIEMELIYGHIYC